MNEEHRPLMTGLFPDRDSAERAYGALTARGYQGSDVSLAITRSRCAGSDG